MSRPEITLETLYDILQNHSQRFDKIELILESHTERLDSHDKRFDTLESLQRTTASRIVSIESRLDEHSAILAILRPLRERLESLHGLCEKLDSRVGRIEQEYVMITAALRRLETRFDPLEADRLRERIIALESRVSALESAS